MQTTIFDMLYPKYKTKKPIRLIEFFAGYGSQALALKYLGVEFQHWRICEWAIKSIQAYKDIHFANDNIDYSNGISKEQIIERLHYFGISSNYNEPMTLEQNKIDDTCYIDTYNKRIDKEKSGTITTGVSFRNNTFLADNNLRIRKLTPRECFRLMGVKDQDYLNCAKNQSDSSLYHLAGDSIVVNVLMAIFRELLESKGE